MSAYKRLSITRYNSLSFDLSLKKLVREMLFLIVLVLGYAIGRVQTNNCSTESCGAYVYPFPLFTQECHDNKQIKDKMNEITAKLDQIMSQLANNSSPYPPSSLLHSCEEIKTKWPDSPSDYYFIADEIGHVRQVFCKMEPLCNSNGGWMRVAYLNMSDPTEECPPGFGLYDENGTRACGRPPSSPGGYCQSVKFPSYNIDYSQVCGRVIGYEYGNPDAIHSRPGANYGFNAAYVDGVSITRGKTRQHIWTFMASLQENSFDANGVTECPCAPKSPLTVPSFIGNDYFCESGNPNNFWEYNVLYTDPLWDGKQCGLIEKACCQAPGLPWFHKTLLSPTTDYIELRVCGDEPTTNEDSPVGYYEIYVK